ncbi:MAG: hypothetical protein NC253_01910 [Ruminococcus sp.]|nr:hypothetical protein [Ruminococcus sp.]MCM1382542.1 hypothetical protein [Muribaculaceae bacterium]MCM1478050.1 hypothetical protein [Muribaculaceae bacterium]
MLRKIKKIIPAVISAILCVTMVLGTTVSAEKKTGSVNVWSESKTLANAKYYSTYIKLAAKYSEKDTKNTVSYSKSRTKKFYDKIEKAANADTPQFSFTLIDKENIVHLACKGSKAKTVICLDGEVGMAIYDDGKKMTILNVGDKTKASAEYGDEDALERDPSYITETLDFGIDESKKGKIFKFKSNDKIYYYEGFESDEYDSVGFLFNENGTALAIVADDEVFCISFKTTVDDSEFTVPKGYKTLD